MKTTADIQRALIALDYPLGKGGPSGKGDDGVWGALSRQALTAYQKAQGLKATGQADPDTLLRLFPAELGRLAVLPPWYAEARRLMGTKEIVGRQHSSAIMGWAKSLKLAYADDETPWCGLFVAHCLSLALPGEAQPANPLGARNWGKFGRPLAAPALGAVLTFWRGTRTGWSGHVGFYAGETATAFRVLGGNQSNAVTKAWLGKERLLDIRWPSTYPAPTSGRVKLSSAGAALSTNEA